MFRKRRVAFYGGSLTATESPGVELGVGLIVSSTFYPAKTNKNKHTHAHRSPPPPPGCVSEESRRGGQIAKCQETESALFSTAATLKKEGKKTPHKKVL